MAFFMIDTRDQRNPARLRMRAVRFDTREDAEDACNKIHAYLRRNNGGSDLGAPFKVVTGAELPAVPPQPHRILLLRGGRDI
jgi:hypothetical protein